MHTTRKGFTLIELLIVVVIIGILAAIAIPKFSNTKGSAQLSSLKSDLRNLASVQETYFANNNTYATGIASLTPTFFNPSSGNAITIASITGGFVATASNAAITTVCVLTYGGTGTRDGSPQCPP